MAHTTPFLMQYTLEAEISNSFPFSIRECVRSGDQQRFIVRIYCKLGQPPSEQEKMKTELDFWKMVQHKNITLSLETFDEDGFIYILYPYPVGGNLATIINDPTKSFTEGFARYVAGVLIKVASFLHSNGIVHGALLPQNVVFYTDMSVPGWVHSGRVAFYKSPTDKSVSIYTDMQDIAYTLCAILRQRAGMFPRNIFHPQFLTGKSWNHLSSEFISLIDRLWNAEANHRNIDYFLKNGWLLGHENGPGLDRPPATSKGLFPLMSPEKMHPPAPKPKQKYIYFKMRERAANGTRRWTKALATLELHYLILDTQIDDLKKMLHSDQILPRVVDLLGKTAVVTSAARHEHTFGIQDIEEQQIVLWVRFTDSADYFEWKQYILDLADPARDKEIEESAPNVVTDTATKNTNGLHMVRALNDLVETTGVAAASELGAEDPLWYHEALVNLANSKSEAYVRQLEAQSASYIRESRSRLGWRWTAGNKEGTLTYGWRLGDSSIAGGSGHKLGSANSRVNLDGIPESVSLAPLPSEHRARQHPALKWQNRDAELKAVLDTGTPVNLPVVDGEEWYVVDASWFRHWVTFVSSNRRMAPPGPIDNLWMIHPRTDAPFLHMIEETDDNRGDFRRVPPQIWHFFQLWYGGGPAISVVGPPIEDTRRWQVHIEAERDVTGDMPTLEELASRLDDPNAVTRKGGKAAVAIKLKKGRRASMAELAFVAAAGGFHDAEGDVVRREEVDETENRSKTPTFISEEPGEEDSEDSEDDDEDELEDGPVFDDKAAAPNMALSRAMLEGGDAEEEKESEEKEMDDDSEPTDEDDDFEVVQVNKNATPAPVAAPTPAPAPVVASTVAPPPKRTSMFGRINH